MTWEELVEKIKNSGDENNIVQTISVPGIEFSDRGDMKLWGTGDGVCKVYDKYTPEQQYNIYKALRNKND